MKDYSTFTCFDNKSGPKTLKIFLHCSLPLCCLKKAALTKNGE